MRILFAILTFAISLTATADYASMPGLDEASRRAAAVFDLGSKTTDAQRRQALSTIRRSAAGYSEAAHSLLASLYRSEGGRYGLLFGILSDEYDRLKQGIASDGYEETDEFDYISIEADDPVANAYIAAVGDDNLDEELCDMVNDYINLRGLPEYGGYSQYIMQLAFFEDLTASEMGYLPSINNVGWALLYGEGVAPNPGYGIQLLQQAANSGIGAAMVNLGMAYFEGRGVAQDYKKAVEWLEKGIAAGERGDDALLRLGYCYEQGLGVTKDVAKAVKIYELATDNYSALNALGYSQSNFSIPARLGILYYSDPSVRDYDKAFRYLKLMADMRQQEVGEVRGFILRCLSACYRFGYGTAEDVAAANRYLKEAAGFGNIDAAKALKMLEVK